MTTEDTSDQFRRFADLQEHSVRMQQEDLDQREQADRVAKQNKELDIDSQLADFDINLIKADRGIREAWVSTAGHAFGMTAVSQQRGGINLRPLMSGVAFVRGMIAVRDAYIDRDLLQKKKDDYEVRAGRKDAPDKDSTKHANSPNSAKSGIHADSTDDSKPWYRRAYDRARQGREDRDTVRTAKAGLFAGMPGQGGPGAMA